jgi:hypothetical protein
MARKGTTNNIYTNGSLKQAIIKGLAKHENIEFSRASFAKYGNGVVELIIHKNNKNK